MEHTLSFNVACGKPCSHDNENIWVDHSYDGWMVEMNLPNIIDNLSSPIRTSVSSGYFSAESTNSSFNSTRSCSTVSPVSSIWSDDLATPPVTPQSNGRWIMATPKASLPQSLASLDILGDTFTEDHTMGEDELWFPSNAHLPLLPTIQQKRSMRYLRSHKGEDNDHLLPINSHTIDPAISRQIFSDPMCSPTHQSSEVFKADWSSSITWSMPQTIAPRAIVQSLLPSSPMSRIDASSPLRIGAFEQRIFGLDSSPLPLPSPRVVPSQREVDEVQRTDKLTVLMPQPLLTRRTQERSARRHQPRKLLSSLSSKPRTVVESVSCDAVIPQNTFACSFPGCIDKSTGRQKRFKRQEHRKRHEITVHKAEKKFFCWVPGCSTGFTRTDNLKNHIKNTHGKNNPAQRNRYVATLDVSSEYYDPSWEGGLTEDGYPLVSKVTLCRCWVPECGKIYHLEDKLRSHLLQHHGKESSDQDESSIGPLDEDEALFESRWEEKVRAHDSPAP